MAEREQSNREDVEYLAAALLRQLNRGFGGVFRDRIFDMKTAPRTVKPWRHITLGFLDAASYEFYLGLERLFQLVKQLEGPETNRISRGLEMIPNVAKLTRGELNDLVLLTGNSDSDESFIRDILDQPSNFILNVGRALRTKPVDPEGRQTQDLLSREFFLKAL